MPRHLTRRQRRKQSLKRSRPLKLRTIIPKGSSGRSILLRWWRIFKRDLAQKEFTIKRWLVKPTIRLFKRYQIRDDFYQIYEANVSELFNNPNLISRTFPEKEIWLKSANYFGSQCVTINPHEKVTKFIENMRENFEKIDNYANKLLMILFCIAMLFGGGGTILSIFNLISDKLFLISVIGSAVFFTLWGYLSLLKNDTDFFHMINKELRLSPFEINKIYRKNRWKKGPLITATIWNCALTDYKMIGRLFLMVIIKILAPKMYNRIVTGFKTVLPKHLEELGKLLEKKDHKKIRKLMFEASKEVAKM